MKFLRHIRSKRRLKDIETSKSPKADLQSTYLERTPPYDGPDCTRNLSDDVLHRIFAEVCPHSQDESYKNSEEGLIEDGCALCDLRDLAQCAQVSKRWWNIVIRRALYKHIRIEPVHYCEREIILAEKRKRKSFFDRNADPIDAPKDRFLQLMRTLRERRDLGSLVLSLRIPYMTRESCKAELARTVAVVPKLRYVDLPEGFFTDEPSSNTLKQELQASCMDIRRMKYSSGSEPSLTQLARNRVWPNLEILELSRINVENLDLLFVLSGFANLREIRFKDLPWLDDSLFRPSSSTVPAFPALQQMTFQGTPRLRAAGLVAYLSQQPNQNALESLSFTMTGVAVPEIHQILSRAPKLTSLSVTEDVDRSFPPDPPIPPLTSNSLKFLHYEITCHSSHKYGLQPVSTSYYTYLSSSLLQGRLASLRHLYVRDGTFPETLLLPPPSRPFSDSHMPSPHLAPRGLNQPLYIYSKGLDEMEWNFTSVEPASEADGRRGSLSPARPVSFNSAESLSPAWGGHARKSVMVGNGFGGFLAVPAEDAGRPTSSGSFGGSKKERRDLWR
ncbi:MAG: hypothetical protein Q9227_006870 [Pyrenula ochraceoflavens]